MCDGMLNVQISHVLRSPFCHTCDWGNQYKINTLPGLLTVSVHSIKAK